MAERRPYDEKLDRILSTSAEIFARKGYHNASIRDIARETGISLSGLYYYFQSKEELLYLIQDNALRTLLDRLYASLDGVADPYLRLRLFIDDHLTYFVDSMAEMKVLTRESESLSGSFQRRVSARKRALVELAAETLQGVRPQSRIDPRVATFTLFGMMNWLYTWYRPGRDVPVARLTEEITSIYLHGFLGCNAQSFADSPSTPLPRSQRG